ncbi:MAG TPA: PaaI family thioesterase [Methanolinea sp.]|nr:PaaI family thioesterase [Methanolinea sp.]HQK55652.1 PaaI family thioesterase [Methanolinea sp.]
MLEKVRHFNQSEFARLLGMEILEARPGYARVRMDTEGKRNLRGFAHGGAIFALADQAFGIAANLGDVDEVALSAQIFYLAPAMGTLTAIAECNGETAQYSSYTVQVFRDNMLVATFEGQGKKQHRG